MGKKPQSYGKLDKRKPISKPVKESFMDKTPYWSFKLLDNTFYKWQIRDATEILNELKAYEGMTWQQISSASGGKRDGHGSNSHFIPIADIIKEAQDRLTFLNLDTEDMIFSLRIGNKKRIWGFLRSRVFEIIWYDDEHEIYSLD